MIDPVAIENMMLAAFAGAFVVIGGALYALVFAFSRMRGQPRLMWWAYAGYAVLAVSALVLANVLNLRGYWQILVVVMLVGYLLAPFGIWNLCVGTHIAEHDADDHLEEGT